MMINTKNSVFTCLILGLLASNILLNAIIETDPSLNDPNKFLSHMTILQGILARSATGMITPIQAKVIPNNSTVLVIGDLHGDTNSLRYNLAQMRAKGYFLDNSLELKNDCYLVFTGDYTDRGLDGIQVWNILCALKQANPEKVFILRGNHEEVSMNIKWGFAADIQTTITNKESIPTIWATLKATYDLMPQALFLGVRKPDDGNVDFVMFCHGSIDRNLTTTSISQALQDALKHGNTLITKDAGNGAQCFMWGDLTTSNSIKLRQPERYPRCKWETQLSIFQYFNDLPQGAAYNISALMRGHQHLPGGILKLKAVVAEPQEDDWEVLNNNQEIQCKGNVFMFMSCPEGLWFSDLKEDSFGILNYDTQNATWILKTNIYARTTMNEYKERLKTTLLRRLDYAYNTLKLRNLKDYNFKTNGIYGVYVELLRYLYGDKIVTADELRQKGLDFIQNIR
jgi:hypothetical protein